MRVLVVDDDASFLLLRNCLLRAHEVRTVSSGSEAWQIAFGGGDEQLVGDVHHDAVVAGGALGDPGFELGGHAPRVSGDVEDVVEARAEFVVRGGWT